MVEKHLGHLKDIFIVLDTVEKLKDYFDVVLCNPKNSESFENNVDLIVFRNTGGVSGFKDIYNCNLLYFFHKQI